MADLKMRVDTALAEVPVNIAPLIDDTDFKTREVAVAFNAAGMDLVWNFITHNGVWTQTAVTPTAAGDYDWAHVGDGMYSIEIPASGGASINNDTEGFGWFTGVATGVLPWRGPIIQLIPDALADIEDGSASVGTAQTGDSYARLGAPAGASIAADIAAAPTTVNDERDTRDGVVDLTVVDDVGNSASTFVVNTDAGSDKRFGSLRLTSGVLSGESRDVIWTGTQVTVWAPDSVPAGLEDAAAYSAEPAADVTGTFRPA